MYADNLNGDGNASWIKWRSTASIEKEVVMARKMKVKTMWLTALVVVVAVLIVLNSAMAFAASELARKVDVGGGDGETHAKGRNSYSTVVLR